jgi:PPOX class probable F420-dependent enzyme
VALKSAVLRLFLKGGLTTMTAIPEKYLDLFDGKKAFANLALVMRDGSPQVTPVWFDYRDGKIRVNTARGRVKARIMKQGTPVALSIMDPDNPYRYVQVRGKITRVIEQGADAHIDSLAKKYLGKDKYPFRASDRFGLGVGVRWSFRAPRLRCSARREESAAILGDSGLLLPLRPASRDFARRSTRAPSAGPSRAEARRFEDPKLRRPVSRIDWAAMRSSLARS